MVAYDETLEATICLDFHHFVSKELESITQS